MAKNKSELALILRPIIFIILVVVIVGLIGYFTLGRESETIQGQVEVNEYRVSSKVPGRILAVYVEEGQKVKAGDTLVRLDAPEVSAKMTQAQSAEQAAQALSDKARKGTRQEQIQGALEMWKKAQAGVAIAENMSEDLRYVWLCHLSEENNHPELARKTVEGVLRSYGIIVGADVQLEVLKRTTPTGAYELK